MSYNYNHILNKIISSRKNHPESIHETLDLYAFLSDHCSMTPLLWLQYAQDARQVQEELAKEIAQLALEEFPGCVLLWLYYLDVDRDWNVWVRAQNNLRGLQDEVILELYQLALKCFPSRMREIYVHRANHLVKGNDAIQDELKNFLPAVNNDSSYQDVEEGRRFASQNLSQLQNWEEDIQMALQKEQLIPTVPISEYFQDTKDTESSGIDIIDWDRYLSALGGITGRYLMGYGMTHTASVFVDTVHYVLQHIRHFKKVSSTHGSEQEKEHASFMTKMYIQFINPLYERAISECPTVEMIWEKYLKHLLYTLYDDNAETSIQDKASALVALKTVSSRAVKNCPYSVKLYIIKMQAIVAEVEIGNKVLEPDDLMEIVQEALESNFLPNNQAHLDVHLAACAIVKRRILHLVSKETSSKPYDQAERIDVGEFNKKRNKSNETEMKMYTVELSDDIEEEVQDLIADLRDMFEATDTYLKKQFNGWTEGRQLLYTEIAKVEAYINGPLLSTDPHGKEVIKSFEKLVRVHSPTHPNSWRLYIKYLLGRSYMKPAEENDEGIVPIPGMMSAKIRFIRNIYQRALPSIKRLMEHKSQADYEYDTSVRLLFQEYMEFENMFGSENSIKAASKLISKKMGLLYEPGQIKHSEELINDTHLETNEYKVDLNGGKRKYSNEANEAKMPIPKHAKIDHDSDGHEATMTSDVPMGINEGDLNPKETKKRLWPESKKLKPEHKVKIGNLEYPAHPYTVYISNLSPETMDSDLYDLFRPKCGPIVHCRIFREKNELYHVADHGDVLKSKCTALIQFEERESVEEALALNGELGLHEKLISVTRSHQPAVGIVPPGMHRINAKGSGRSTKRNEMRKERRLIKSKEKKMTISDVVEQTPLEGTNDGVSDTVASRIIPTANANILSFRPRNVKGRPKKRI
jgi:RNA recognition motif-containing protein